MAENSASAADALSGSSSPDHASVLEMIIEARLRALGPAREVARAAAVAGGRFTLPLLRELLPELSEDVIAEALRALGEAGLLSRLRHGGAAAYGYRHALIQETIYNATLRKRRQALHASLVGVATAERSGFPLGWWIGPTQDFQSGCTKLDDSSQLVVPSHGVEMPAAECCRFVGDNFGWPTTYGRCDIGFQSFEACCGVGAKQPYSIAAVAMGKATTFGRIDCENVHHEIASCWNQGLITRLGRR